MVKHLQKLYALVLLCCAFLATGNAWGQAQYEPFATTGALTTMTGWAYNTGTAGQLQVVTGNLTYSNLPSSQGNKVALKSSDSEDAKLTLTNSVTSGSVYASFLFKPESGFLANSTSGGYFAHFIANNSSTFLTRLSIREGSAANTFNLGVINYSGTPTPTNSDIFGANPVDYQLGQTYLVVLKYDIGTNISSIWINPTLGESESSALVSNSAGSTPSVSKISEFGIRQSNSSGLGTGNMEIDEVRIGTTWAAVTPTSTPTTTPTLTPSTGSLDFGDVLIGSNSIASYQLSASNIPSGKDVSLNVSGNFTISTTESGTYATSLVLTATDLASAKTIYVKASPTASGNQSGEILHTLEGASNATVALTVNGASPFVQEFTNCTNGENLTGGWMQYSVSGAQTWACTTFGKEGNGVQMNGYSGGNNANEDWLISPKLDLTTFANLPVLTVDFRTKFAGDALVVKVSTDYTGSGDPAAATWTNLIELPANNADVWSELQGINLTAYKSANTYVAFVYTSTTEAAARWTLDNFRVTNESALLNYSNVEFRFTETAVGNASTAQEFQLRVEGLTENLTVTAPTNFEVSKDNTTFASTVTYTAAEAATFNTVYVRFKPTETKANIEAQISLASGTASESIGYLYGSSILKANTLDVVTWNLEWFGSTSNGPTDEELQFTNAKAVISALNADIIALQEIVDEAKVQQLASETGYSYESMTISEWQSSGDQKLGFLYKPSVVTVKKEKVILSKLYADIKAGTTTLTDYPNGNSSLLWSSGRLPYMVQFEANIDGVKQLYNVINLHAKATVSAPATEYERRKYDAKVLADTLAAQYADANLIILGDFNDDVDVSVVNNNTTPFDVFVSSDKYKTLTYDLSVAGKVTYESGTLSSFLDHIIISKSLEDEYISSSVFIENYFDELITNYRNTTSDHAPVSARFYISSDNTTGIADATKGQFSVYPNPAHGYVNLALPAKVGAQRNINLSVWSVDGRKMFDTTANLEAAKQSLNSKVGNFANGVYIIKIQAGNEVYQARLMKN